ncbi:unnamed protein product [Acanthosepion pharaonis]|uniref:Uncharacterized protein n=1 Tax=Acanthosepion pharaonis TaxID=158019 RepID=A0A812B739_ACAPH|nr:unnamed protein product [Sepia pharaonis]
MFTTPPSAYYPTIIVKNSRVKVVDTFPYLRSTLSKDGAPDAEIIQSVNQPNRRLLVFFIPISFLNIFSHFTCHIRRKNVNLSAFSVQLPILSLLSLTPTSLSLFLSLSKHIYLHLFLHLSLSFPSLILKPYFKIYIFLIVLSFPHLSGHIFSYLSPFSLSLSLSLSFLPSILKL